MRRGIVAIVAASFFSLATLDSLRTEDDVPKSAYPNDSLSDGLSRIEQIKRCATCHPKEYQNELIGPHWASYTKLMEHISYVQTSPHYTDEWREGVKNKLQACLSCHAGSNLYETVFSGLESEANPARFTEENYPKLFYPPPPREDEDSRITGVDCLTCHARNNKVITHAGFKPSGIKMEGQCDVVPSVFFSNDLNCVSCHNFTFKNTMKNVSNGLVAAHETNCLKCHQEYDESGKGTHYYYWKHDPPQKKRPHSMELFHCITVSLKQEEAAQYIIFHWQNNNAPHGYPDCAEYIIELALVASARDTIPLGIERINRKVDQGATMKAIFKSGEPPGIPGYCNYIDSEPLHREYRIENISDLNLFKVLVTLKVKSQYWAGDAEARLIGSRIFDLKN
ncbi:MAG TPA: hypothetical protein VNJ07_06080 [Chitinophagales bacterium]|nr:hypothetical protein [Chitinophagales bacterium]